MKWIVLFVVVLGIASGDDTLEEILEPVDDLLQPLRELVDPLLDDAWDGFKNMFDKMLDGVEDLTRRINFEKALSIVAKHNVLADLGLVNYTLGINKYSDLSPEEMSSKLFGFLGNNNYPSQSENFNPPKAAAIPASVDWKKKGYLTPVKDQGECGSCWAFSTTGALEAHLKKKTGKLVSLSEQNLVDCSQSEGNAGCDGGWMNQAYKYIKTNGGIDTEDSYPYIQAVGNCSYAKSGSGGTVTGYVNIPSGDEKALMKAVATAGPVNVAINADGDFAYYQSGIYDPPVCPNTIYDLTHALLVVGYGTENGQDYWLVRNSWGDSFGLEGYIKIARNKGNKCGIATKASYPLV